MMYEVYGDYRSDNCYKIRLVMSLLSIDYQWVPVDILKGETQTPEFLAKNLNGKIPMLELEDGGCLRESNAILDSLADGSTLSPSEPCLCTQVLQWQFFEQYSHEPYVAVVYFIKLYLGLSEVRHAEFEEKKIGGCKAFDVIEEQLPRMPLLVGGQFSIAGITLYTYTHAAYEGSFDPMVYLAACARIK